MQRGRRGYQLLKTARLVRHLYDAVRAPISSSGSSLYGSPFDSLASVDRGIQGLPSKRRSRLQSRDAFVHISHSKDFVYHYKFSIHPCRSFGFAFLNVGSKRTSPVVAGPFDSCSHHSFRFYSSWLKHLRKADSHDPSQQAVTTALWCNFLVFSLKFGVWLETSSHVMLAEVIHSLADFANQALLAYGLNSSRRAPDALHPYGYSKERFVWSLISAVGIFCLGSGATIVHGFQNLWNAQPPQHIFYAALVIGGSFIIEGASLVVAINAVKKGAAAEGMKIRDYVWRGHDPTSVAVMTEDGAAVTGLLIAAASLVAVNRTGNAIYDPIGSIVVGHLLGMVAIFLIQRNRHALIGRAIDDHDMERVLRFLSSDPVVDAIYDCKSEVIGPGFFRFKAEIDFNGVVVVQNYLERTGREEWARQFREATMGKDDAAILKTMANYGEEVVTALGSEVDRLEKEIQKIVPGIRHVDIEAHNPKGPSP
ncbi:hypothetical protein AMTRI_Chr12g241840 [Amborella trichopoda]|uniref:metal tolerance protein C4 isoform X1 n=1 Tax=Amborella trichopoda TaxID=13333 RepID=UPI0005D3041C|nr:metal tolerance protein C4 isoform X1 [Amborella trichopoda]|eukprot:XP_011623887.1 metal tolerance protein C4 isoform X1 [Amborella trichopoda]